MRHGLAVDNRATRSSSADRPRFQVSGHGSMGDGQTVAVVGASWWDSVDSTGWQKARVGPTDKLFWWSRRQISMDRLWWSVGGDGCRRNI